MKRRVAIACVVAGCLAAGASAGEVFEDATLAFARKVDGEALSLLAVQYRGRVAILDTLAREQLKQMYGSETIDTQEPAAAYLELYFGAGRYADQPLIYVREKTMRSFLRERLDAGTSSLFSRSHRLPPAALFDAEAWAELIRTGRATPQDRARAASIAGLGRALAELSERKELRVPMDRLRARSWSFLAMGMLRVVPWRGDQWLSAEHALRMAGPAAGAGPAVAKWAELRDAWQARDAEKVNRLIGEFTSLAAREAGADYPSARVRSLERLYTRTNGAAPMLAGYAVALMLLVVAAASGRTWARRTGLAVFALTTLAMLASFLVRWLISGRQWYLPPIMNQYEAVIGSALLGAVITAGLELAWKRNYFALAASLYSVVALLAGLLFPEQMDASLRAQPGILSSPVMAAHVAVIIVGHALVGMTFFISLTYLSMLLLIGSPQGPAAASAAPDLRAAGELTTLAVIDRCNLIVAQLACWSVVVGTILGAYWGDFAWGRWWGWDPKETVALITCLVYVALLHLRFVVPARRRGLVTALACILGCAVMLFNWIVVNFVLAGKHSYA